MPSNVLNCNDPFEFDNNPFYIKFKNLDEVDKYYKSLFQLYRQENSSFLSREVSQRIKSMTSQEAEEAMNRAIRATKKVLIPYKSQYLFEYQESIVSFEKLKNFGVIYCFSRCDLADAVLLWGHYAHCHTGVAFEFDFSADKYKGRVHKVEYPDHLKRGGVCSLNEAIQLLSLADKSTEVQSLFFKKTALDKHKDWSYEKEWRMISVKDDANPSPHLKLTGDILKSIYFGLNMEKDLKEKIAEMAIKKIPSIQLYEAEKDLAQKKLNFKRFKRA